MSKPYDASTKFLIETLFSNWVAHAPRLGTRVEGIDSDLSTVTSMADKVLRVIEPERGTYTWSCRRARMTI